MNVRSIERPKVVVIITGNSKTYHIFISINNSWINPQKLQKYILILQNVWDGTNKKK